MLCGIWSGLVLSGGKQAAKLEVQAFLSRASVCTSIHQHLDDEFMRYLQHVLHV